MNGLLYVADLPPATRARLCEQCVPPVLAVKVQDVTWVERLAGRLSAGPRRVRPVAVRGAERLYQQFVERDGCLHLLTGHPPQWWGVKTVIANPIELRSEVLV